MIGNNRDKVKILIEYGFELRAQTEENLLGEILVTNFCYAKKIGRSTIYLKKEAINLIDEDELEGLLYELKLVEEEDEDGKNN